MSRRQDAELTNELEDLGLTPTEAAAYLALLRLGRLGARDLAEATGTKRSSIYPVLRTLQERGLVEGGTGYGSRFDAVAPERALPGLVDHERVEIAEALSRKEAAAKEVAARLAELHASKEESTTAELAEVIRNPRAVTERFARLQLEAKESIEMFVKAPFVATSGNPEEMTALSRGVRVRSLYEEAILDDDAVRPHLQRWLSRGEEARVLRGELPFKLALIDRTFALMPLDTPHSYREVTSLLVRNTGLGGGLALLFDWFWSRATDVSQ